MTLTGPITLISCRSLSYVCVMIVYVAGMFNASSMQISPDPPAYLRDIAWPPLQAQTKLSGWECSSALRPNPSQLTTANIYYRYNSY